MRSRVGDLRDPRRPSASRRRRRSVLPPPRVPPAHRADGRASPPGSARVLDADTLVAEAAQRQRRTPLPSPRNLPIDTFVVLMMENRSFDHYLGWLPERRRPPGGPDLRRQGRASRTPRTASTPDCQGCGHPDPDHSWEGGRTQLNGGTMRRLPALGRQRRVRDRLLRRGATSASSRHAAQAFTTFDRFFCSLMALDAAQPRVHARGAVLRQRSTTTLPPQTGTRRASRTRRSSPRCSAQGRRRNRYFYNDVPVVGAVGRARRWRARAASQEYYAALRDRARCPRVSFVDPKFAGRGRAARAVGRRAPARRRAHRPGVHGRRRARVHGVAAVEARRAVHRLRRVGRLLRPRRPPRVPDDRNSRDIDKDFGLMGFRIPAVAVSPYARRGHVAHSIYGFESILKMIEYRFGLAPLTRRDALRAQHRALVRLGVQAAPRAARPARPADGASRSAEPRGERADATAGAQRPKDHDLMDLRHVRLPRPARLRLQARDRGDRTASRTGCRRVSRALSAPGRGRCRSRAARADGRGRGEICRHARTTLAARPRNDRMGGRGGNDRSSGCAATTGSTAARARTAYRARPGTTAVRRRGQ